MQRRHTHTCLHTHTHPGQHTLLLCTTTTNTTATVVLLLPALYYCCYCCCNRSASLASSHIFDTWGAGHASSLSLSPSIASPPDFAPRRPLVYRASPFSLPRGRWTRVAALDGRLHSLCGQQAVGCWCIFCEHSIPRSSVRLSARCYGKGERERSLASPSA